MTRPDARIMERHSLFPVSRQTSVMICADGPLGIKELRNIVQMIHLDIQFLAQDEPPPTATVIEGGGDAVFAITGGAA